MKKFLLVPPQSLPPSTLVRKLGELDTEMKSIFDRTDVDEYEKAQIYSRALDKYITVKDKLSRPTPVPIIEQNPIPTTRPHTEETSEPVKSRIEMNLFPTTYRNRAQNLLNHIEKHSALGWNSKGELLVNGLAIAGSNIIDLVDDAVRFKKNKREPPTGSETFVDGLLDSNVPRSIIGNKKLLDRSYDTPPPSPLAPTPTATPRGRGFPRPRPRSQQTGYGLLKWENL